MTMMQGPDTRARTRFAASVRSKSKTSRKLIGSGVKDA